MSRPPFRDPDADVILRAAEAGVFRSCADAWNERKNRPAEVNAAAERARIDSATFNGGGYNAEAAVICAWVTSLASEIGSDLLGRTWEAPSLDSGWRLVPSNDEHPFWRAVWREWGDTDDGDVYYHDEEDRGNGI